MENNVIVYDKVFEIARLSSFSKVNELLEEYTPIDETTCCVWDVIACFKMDILGNDRDEVVYVLGKKYKRIDHINK